MISYQILEEVYDKNRYKAEIFEFFRQVFGKELKESDWFHFFLNSPYEKSLLVLAQSNDTVVGTANLIPQKINAEGKIYDYYHFITSAIHESFKSEGIYLDQINIIKEISKKNNKDFILAFPNENAYLPLTKLFHFTPLGKMEIVSINNLNFREVKTIHVKRSIILEEQYLKWRLEHKEYYFAKYNNKIIIYKIYSGAQDILEVIDDEYERIISKYINHQNMNISKNINILQERMRKSDSIKNISTFLNPTYFAFEKSLQLERIDISLLMSDVF